MGVPLSLWVSPHPSGEVGNRNRWVDVGKKFWSRINTPFIGIR